MTDITITPEGLRKSIPTLVSFLTKTDEVFGLGAHLVRVIQIPGRLINLGYGESIAAALVAIFENKLFRLPVTPQPQL